MASGEWLVTREERFFASPASPTGGLRMTGARFRRSFGAASEGLVARRPLLCRRGATGAALRASKRPEVTTMSKLAIWAELQAKPGKENHDRVTCDL